MLQPNRYLLVEVRSRATDKWRMSAVYTEEEGAKLWTCLVVLGTLHHVEYQVRAINVEELANILHVACALGDNDAINR